MVDKAGRHSVRRRRSPVSPASIRHDVAIAASSTAADSDFSPVTTPLAWRTNRRSGDSGLLSGTVKLVVSNAGTNVLGLLSGIALARGLGPSGRGEYQVSVLIYTLVPAILNLNIGTVVASTPLESPLPVRNIRRLVTILVLIGTVAAGTAAFACGLQRPVLLVLMCSAIGFMTSDVTQGILRRHSQFSRVALMRWLDVGGSSLAIAVLFIIGKLSVVTATVALVGTTIIAVVVGWRRARPMVAGETARSELERGRVALVHGSSAVRSLASYIDQISVGAAVGAAGLGQYALAANLARQISIIPAALSTVTFQMARRDGDDNRDRASFVLRMILLMALSVGIVAWFLAPMIFGRVFGSGFSAAGRVAAVLVVSVGINGLLEVLETILIGLGRPEVPLRCRLLGLTTLLVSVPFLFHARSPVAATAVAGSMSIVALSSCLFLSGRGGGPSPRSVLIPRFRDDGRYVATLARRLF